MIEWYDAAAFTPPTTEDVLICTEVIAWAYINYPDEKED